ncbi:MAG: SDR family oxidoreductase [Bacteroidia bacterium]|nr:SDR family oxidoreductase [Bacteroidia bacterium]
MQKTVWITGASSGIGEALALEYAKENANLILSARNEEELNRVAKECTTGTNKVIVAPLDLAKSESFTSLVSSLRKQIDRIDILINNGGISQRSLVSETPLEVDRKLFEINYFGTVALTKAVLPWMIETGGGNITAISSISGKFGFPLRSAYSATKHALFGFFETLGLEQVNNNIHTTIICPGRIQTNISTRALDKEGNATNEMDKGLADGMPASKCAKKIVRAIQKNKREAWVGGKEILMVYIRKYFPRLFWKIAPNIDPK